MIVRCCCCRGRERVTRHLNMAMCAIKTAFYTKLVMDWWEEVWSSTSYLTRKEVFDVHRWLHFALLDQMELIFLRIILRCYKTFIKTEYINIDQKRICEKQRHFPSQIQMQLESVSELRLEGIKKEIHRNVLASDGSLLHLRWRSNSEGNRGTLWVVPWPFLDGPFLSLSYTTATHIPTACVLVCQIFNTQKQFNTQFTHVYNAYLRRYVLFGRFALYENLG